MVEVTYLTVQDTAAPVVVESEGQGGGTKYSAWVSNPHLAGGTAGRGMDVD